MLKRLQVRQRERAFLYRDRDYVGLIPTGSHWFFDPLNRIQFKLYDTHDVELESDDLKTLLADPEVAEMLHCVQLSENQRAFVWLDGRLYKALGPGEYAFWRSPHKVQIDVQTLDSVSFEHKNLDQILSNPESKELLEDIAIPRGSKALLYVNENFVKLLEAGRYGFWRGLAKVRVEPLELREQQLDVMGQEMLTKDNVSLRINLVATWQVLDPQRASESISNLHGSVYRELQLALREQVSRRSLEDLLSHKESMSQDVYEVAAPAFEAFGSSLKKVGVKDVILPGDMKTLMNRVIEAEKQAKANVITRREETAATRSLLNTAKMIENNPTLLRLKELEVAERIAERVKSIHIQNGLDDLIDRLVPRRDG